MMPPPDHGGCAYTVKADCERSDCRPAELCPAGYQVYRIEWGGHHHG